MMGNAPPGPLRLRALRWARQQQPHSEPRGRSGNHEHHSLAGPRAHLEPDEVDANSTRGRDQQTGCGASPERDEPFLARETTAVTGAEASAHEAAEQGGKEERARHLELDTIRL